MTLSLDEILDRHDDSELCNGLFKRIIDFHGADSGLYAANKSERVVVFIWDAMGRISNGGFNYLFESVLEWDPDFSLTAGAFGTVGCAAAVEAFRLAFSQFDGGTPPSDVDRRLDEFRRGGPAVRSRANKLFWNAGEEIHRQLAGYVRLHRDSFAHLANLPTTGTADVDNKEELDEPSDIDPVAELPHWARVALAARCARDVLPIFAKNWPSASAKHRLNVIRAIEMAEHSAAQGHAASGISDAITNAYVTVGSALRALYGDIGGSDEEDDERDDPCPSDGNAGTAASFAARVAVKAAEAAAGDAGASIEYANDALSTAFAAIEGERSGKIARRLQADFAKLQRITRTRRSNDSTPFPAGVFDSRMAPKPWWKFWS
jgi:hypothetical protein